LNRRKEKEKTILLIRLDAIGDYILFRNFIEILKKSEKYKHYHVTLCGNIIWKSLAETFDKNIADDFIWLERKKFYFNFIYKYRFLKNIYNSGYETVIEATHSREILFGDTIVNAAKAKNSIGSVGSGEEFTVWKRKMLTNKLYSELIEISNDNLFEFEINKELFSKLLQDNVAIKKPHLDTSSLKTENAINKYILLFPGSSDPKRMWSTENFKAVAKYLISKYDFNIVVSGSYGEAYLFSEIIVENCEERFYNLFGNTLPELAKLIAEAELIISNDTSAVHFAAAVNTPFICISNGSYFGRFNPYPANIYEKAITIYPSIIHDQLKDIEKLKQQYRFNSDIDINEIKPQVVIDLLKKLLKP
jgi:ADP-heptose:LPS heptosyltransferase